MCFYTLHDQILNKEFKSLYFSLQICGKDVGQVTPGCLQNLRLTLNSKQYKVKTFLLYFSSIIKLVEGQFFSGFNEYYSPINHLEKLY